MSDWVCSVTNQGTSVRTPPHLTSVTLPITMSPNAAEYLSPAAVLQDGTGNSPPSVDFEA